MAFELNQMPETLEESAWLDRLIEMSPGCKRVMKNWKPDYDLPPALRGRQDD